MALSNRRAFEATVKFATAIPAGVKRNSGSAVREPVMVRAVSFMSLLLVLVVLLARRASVGR